MADILQMIFFHIHFLVVIAVFGFEFHSKFVPNGPINSLAPGRFELNFRYLILQIISVIDGCGISCKVAFRWMSLDLTDDKSTLVQVMAWRRQATSHYLSQFWPRSLSLYGVIRPQWVNNKQALVQIMAWRRTGDKPLPEQMLIAHICDTRYRSSNMLNISQLLQKHDQHSWQYFNLQGKPTFSSTLLYSMSKLSAFVLSI